MLYHRLFGPPSSSCNESQVTVLNIDYQSGQTQVIEGASQLFEPHQVLHVVFDDSPTRPLKSAPLPTTHFDLLIIPAATNSPHTLQATQAHTTLSSHNPNLLTLAMLLLTLRKLNSLTCRILPHLPGPWRLPILTRMLKWTTNDEREAFHLSTIGPCKGHAIDIGANYGLYSYSLQRHYDSVTAFEPNTAIAAPLIAAAYPNVRIVHDALSSHSGTAILHIPKQNGVILSGWASLEPEVTIEAQSLIDIEVPISTLDSHQLQNVGFIKIDVEGHELEVLLGAEQTIHQFKPHLVIEIQDKHLPAIRSLLASWNYTETTLAKLGGPNGSPQNYIFLPTPSSL